MGSIGVFDSGIGGFSILKDLVKVFKNQNIYYFADQKHIPYSTKSEEFIANRSIEISEFLKNKGCSTIVIACNTATVFSISKLRKKFKKISFVGVEPAIKPAAKTKGSILVLATQNTIKSTQMEDLVEKYAKGRDIFFQDMSNWVTWAEKGMIDEPFVEEHSRQKLSQYLNHKISSIVLACTHYPLYIPLLEKIFKDVVIIDPSAAVAAQAKKIHESSEVKKRKIVLFSSKSKALIANSSNLLSFPVEIESI